MTEEPLPDFEYRANLYLNVNYFDAVGLKKNLELPGNEEIANNFQAGLKSAIEKGVPSRDQYEQLTRDDFEDDEDYIGWLRKIWSFLYEDGPIP